jgi:hypothetical protein
MHVPKDDAGNEDEVGDEEEGKIADIEIPENDLEICIDDLIE